MNDLEVAYLQGMKSWKYGATCTCPFAEGPWVKSWWQGYRAASGSHGKMPKPDIELREVAVGTLQSPKYYDKDRGE
jgi:hypothetical protein